MRVKYCLQFLSIIYVLGITHLASATVITPQAGQQISFNADYVAGHDFLNITPPNSAGISVNKFSRFDVNAPLKLVNTPSYHEVTGAPMPSAKTVVIIASDITLSSVIDVVGPATDIVMIAASEDGTLTCQNCSFSNALRLSLITGDLGDLKSSSSSLDSVRPKGRMIINTLYAPGVIGLDLVSSVLLGSGTININQAAIKNASAIGGYSAAPHGTYAIGAGSIDVILGSLVWNYEGRKIHQASAGGLLRNVAHTFKAPRVSISSAGDLKFQGKIDTRVNVLSAVSYQSEMHIPQEGATVQALAKNANVNVLGDVYSDNAVKIRATKNIAIGRTAHVKANTIELLAGMEVYNDGQLEAIRVGQPATQSLIGIAGDTVINQQRIDSYDSVDIFAEKGMSNQYGGVLQGGDVRITVANGVIKNGSRTPYIDNSAGRWSFLQLNKSPLLTHLTNSPDADASTVDTTQEGAFFWVPGGVITQQRSSLKMPQSHLAHILGQHIQLRADGIENINPYYEHLDLENQTFTSNERLRDVAISAEQTLTISGPPVGSSTTYRFANYFVNASALSIVNNVQGSLDIRAQKVVNGRYRTETVFYKGGWSNSVLSDTQRRPSYLESAKNVSSLKTTNSKNDAVYHAAVAVFSPPGFIASMNKLNIQTDRDSASQPNDFVVNAFGYLEVFGEARIDTTTFKNLGLARHGFASGRFKTTYKKEVYRRGEWLYDEEEVTETINQLLETVELDSLFYVKGTLNIPVRAWYETVNPFRYFVNQAALKEGDFGIPKHSQTTYDSGFKRKVDPRTGREYFEGELDELSRIAYVNYFTYSTPKNVSIDFSQLENINQQQGKVKVKYDYTQRSNLIYSHYKRDLANAPDEDITITIEGEKEFALLDLLSDYYESVKNKISAIVSEFKWWGDGK
ncbi:hypothetical protein [Marinagarivorans algicola]|uniref:hypothetical protein n=1 Tax=Marinagarivorans algicola TaxID=1513270 RepID=UPI0006B8F5C0|nr:hypothetical protein [Marinagarivorans algicola]